MRRAFLVSVIAWLVPWSAVAQQGAAAAPRTEGPMTGAERREFGGDRLNGATGSVALQVGGGS